jgi:hypothetical protein
MKLHVNKNRKPWVILAILIAAALLAVFWAVNYLHIPPPRLARPYPGDIELYYTVKTVISTVNVTLLVFLFITYVDIYRKIKSDFTVWLMIFTVILLFYALSSNPIVHWIFGFRAFGLGPFAMLPDLFTCAALIVLLYLTLKY